MIKNSWVLANLCANLTHFDKFSLAENNEILGMILLYCSSAKEKLVSNAYRALGYFISNNSDQILVELISNAEGGPKTLQSLREAYLRSFEPFSVKVCWNICVSFSNILKATKTLFMSMFFCEEIIENMRSILLTKNNFKTQIHCIEMLILAYEQFPNSKCFANLIKALCQIYFLADEGQFDVTEMRYLPQLRSNINKFLIKLLGNRDLIKEPGELIEILNTMPNKFFKIFYDQLESLYKDREDKINEEWEENKEDNSAMGRKLEKISDFDELRVKGKSDQNKIFIPARKLKIPELVGLMDYLNKTNKIFKEIAFHIDSTEEMSLPFTIYDSVKQLAEFNPEQTSEDVSLEIYRF